MRNRKKILKAVLTTLAVFSALTLILSLTYLISIWISGTASIIFLITMNFFLFISMIYKES